MIKDSCNEDFIGMSSFILFCLSALFLAIFFIVAGCKQAVVVSFRDSTGITAGTWEIANTIVPAIGYESGLSLTTTIGVDQNATIEFQGNANVTNTTDLAGLYEGKEAKNLSFNGKIESNK